MKRFVALAISDLIVLKNAAHLCVCVMGVSVLCW